MNARLTPAQADLFDQVKRTLAHTQTVSGRAIGQHARVRTTHPYGAACAPVDPRRNRAVGSASTLARLAAKGYLVPMITYVGTRGAEVTTYQLAPGHTA